ncbi:MAG: 30S ribosomal protein S20 [Christensenellales bacterium]
MANIKSAAKRAVVSQRQRQQNTAVKSNMRTSLKKFSAADAEQAKELYDDTVSTVDKAAAKGVIHKNAANRKKAQLAKMMAAK